MELPVSLDAAAVPPTRSMTSPAEVSTSESTTRSRNCEVESAIAPDVINDAFITQGLRPRLWRPSGGFETIAPMAGRAENPESTRQVAARLRLTREAFAMNKAVWCRFIGMTPQAWQNVEGSENTPATNRISLDEALKVCRTTGVGLDWIYRGERDHLPVKVAIRIQELEQEQDEARPPRAAGKRR